MFNLKDMAKEQPTHNLENDGTAGDAVAAFADGYEVGMGEAQIESGFDVLAEANDDMDTLVEARTLVDQNLESGEVTAELGEAYRTTMLRMEGKYGITGLADANLESADAVKGFLKKLAASARMIIAKIAAMAKKVWLKFSAWLASSDSKVKELKKKLEKMKEEVTKNGKVIYVSGEETGKKIIKTRMELYALTRSVGEEDKLGSIDKKQIQASLKEAFTISKNAGTTTPDNKIALREITLNDGVEFSNDKDSHLAKASGTKMYLCGADFKKVTILMVNDAYTPEDSDNDPVYTARIVNVSRDLDLESEVDKAVESIYGSHDFSNGGKYISSAESLAKIEEGIAATSDLPKASVMQTDIKNGFKDLDKMAKAVEKEFGKPDEWAEKGKQAVAKKDAYIAGSKAVYSCVRTGIAAYRLGLSLADSVSKIPLKKEEKK